jgi:hypothetical protein
MDSVRIVKLPGMRQLSTVALTAFRDYVTI